MTPAKAATRRSRGSRFVISEKALKPPTVAAPKNKAHKRQGIGASFHIGCSPSHLSWKIFGVSRIDACSLLAACVMLLQLRADWQRLLFICLLGLA